MVVLLLLEVGCAAGAPEAADQEPEAEQQLEQEHGWVAACSCMLLHLVFVA
jgi:hypothetical protein